MIIENLNKNAAVAKQMLVNAIKNMPGERRCGCGETLRNAIVTRKEAVPAETLEKLSPIIEGFI